LFKEYTNLPSFPSLRPYRLVDDSYTKNEVDTKDTYNSNGISTMITNLPQPDLTPYRLIADRYTKDEVDKKDTNNSNVIFLTITNLPSKFKTL